MVKIPSWTFYGGKKTFKFSYFYKLEYSCNLGDHFGSKSKIEYSKGFEREYLGGMRFENAIIYNWEWF